MIFPLRSLWTSGAQECRVSSLHRAAARQRLGLPGQTWVLPALCTFNFRTDIGRPTISRGATKCACSIGASRIIWECPHNKREQSNGKTWFVTVVCVPVWPMTPEVFEEENKTKQTSPGSFKSKVWQKRQVLKSFSVWAFRYIICAMETLPAAATCFITWRMISVTSRTQSCFQAEFRPACRY